MVHLGLCQPAAIGETPPGSAANMMIASAALVFVLAWTLFS
jgi:hypothetical protein